MSKRIVEAIFPELEGKVYKASLHEGMNILYIYDIFCIYILTKLFMTELDGDQLVDFYWIDPLLPSPNMQENSTFNLSQRSHGTSLVFAHLVVSMGG